MKLTNCLLTLCLYFIGLGFAAAQSPGLIVRPPGGNGVATLNPNGDAYSSATSTGFISDDILESEITYKIIPVAVAEPTGDLATGPTGGFSDIVKRLDGSGFYLFKDATNIYFRLRIGDIISGSKGYSVLIDTDGKMGASGPNADPNYLAPGGTNSGNPGFEYEVTFESNSRVAVYNIDGTSTPVLVTSYGINSNSQISVALSTDSFTPDYFYDWYVPLTAIGSPTSIRLLGTTITSPNSALQGNRSDIYGIDDANYSNNATAWQTVINAQPSINLTTFTGVGATCTAAPILTGPIAIGSSVSVSGTWTRLDITKPSTATIKLYKNDVLVNTTSVSTGGTWNITVPTIASGDVFYAKAVSTGESECLISNKVQAVGCTNQTPLTGVSILCGTLRGYDGQAPSTAVVRIYTVTTSGYTLFADETTTTYKVSHPATGAPTRWIYDGPNTNSADPCTGGATDVPAASYAITVQLSGQCESDYFSYCDGLTQTATPVITQTTLTESSTTVSGTAAASSLVRLFISGQFYGTVTANGSGAYSFASLVLRAGNVVEVSAQTTGQCVSVRASRTVICTTAPPTINTDISGNLIVGATTITGKSVEPTGTTIRVYNDLTTLVGTTTVLSNGTWSITYTVVSGRSYYATAQNGTCTVSTNSTSATALAITSTCATISGSPTESTTPITGTLGATFTGIVTLYLDDVSIGTQNVTSATVWSITPSMSLYYNGVLKATTKATGSAESIACSSKTIACTSPSTPSITPTSSNITVGQQVTFNVSNVNASSWYALLDNNGTSYATSSYRTTSSNFTLQSNVFNTVGTYSLKLTADKLSGCPASFSTATVTVAAIVLPVEFTKVSAIRRNEGVQVLWEVAQAINVDYYQVERSLDGTNFQSIGVVTAKKSSQSSQYSLLDNSVEFINQNIYYRVKEVDFDGQYEFSRIVFVANNQSTVLTVIPNPASYEANVSIKLETSEEAAVIDLIDVNGNVVFTLKLSLNKGENELVIDNLATQPRGYYFLRLRSAKGTMYRKLVLQ